MSEIAWFFIFMVALITLPMAAIGFMEHSRRLSIADCVRVGGEPSACRMAME